MSFDSGITDDERYLFTDLDCTPLSANNYQTIVRDENTPPEFDEFPLKRRRRKRGETITPHKIIEKRRRDRINRSLEQLRDLVPAATAKGAKNDKVYLLQVTIQHLKELQDCNTSDSSVERDSVQNTSNNSDNLNKTPERCLPEEVMREGYRDCSTEVFNFLMTSIGLDNTHPLVSGLKNHLEKREKSLEWSSTNQYEESFPTTAHAQYSPPICQSSPIGCYNQSPFSDQSPTTPTSHRIPEGDARGRTRPQPHGVPELNDSNQPLSLVMPPHPKRLIGPSSPQRQPIGTQGMKVEPRDSPVTSRKRTAEPEGICLPPKRRFQEECRTRSFVVPQTAASWPTALPTWLSSIPSQSATPATPIGPYSVHPSAPLPQITKQDGPLPQHSKKLTKPSHSIENMLHTHIPTPSNNILPHSSTPVSANIQRLPPHMLGLNPSDFPTRFHQLPLFPYPIPNLPMAYSGLPVVPKPVHSNQIDFQKFRHTFENSGSRTFNPNNEQI